MREEEGLGLRMLKRRRTQDSDLNDVITQGASGTPKYVERMQVKNIDTPKVRLLPATEVKNRLAAITAYGTSIKQGKSDKEKEALAAIDTLCPGESSDEEDTSDEAYVARHAIMEVEEKARYNSLIEDKARARKEQGKTPKEGRSLKPARAKRAGSGTPSGGPLNGRSTPVNRRAGSVETSSGKHALNATPVALNQAGGGANGSGQQQQQQPLQLTPAVV